MLAVVAERRRTARELAASRTRILTAADAERHRITRDLHDGAQQRLILLRIRLGLLADELSGSDLGPARATIDRLGEEIDEVLTDVRTLSAGIYPLLLTNHGLGDAVRSLARQAPVGVAVDVDPLSVL